MSVPAGTAFGLTKQLPVRVSETEWIKIAVQEPALSLEERCQRHGLVRLYSCDRLVEHSPSFLGRPPLLRERGGRERESRSFSGLCPLPPAADIPSQMLTAAMCQQRTNAVQQKTLKL